MTNEQQEEAGPVTVQIGVCSVCHALFLISGDRETSPCHGSDTLAVLATLTIGPDAQVTGEWGLGARSREPDITDEPAPPAEEKPPAPAAEEEPTGIPQPLSVLEEALSTAVEYLSGGGQVEDSLRELLLAAGAEPEDAAVAIGRLDAVRALLLRLHRLAEPAPVAPAPSEAENSPENS